MDPNIPNWLDKTFLRNILKDEEENKDVDVEVVRFSVEPAMAPGNNYLSYMYRVRVEYKTRHSLSNKTVSLMVKIPFAEGFMKELSERHNFFDKEPKIYNELLPLLKKITLCEFGPESLNCPVKNVLVMKDLKEDGYILKDKTNQLDFFHSKAVIIKMAKFHAASVVCINNNKELVKEVGEDHFFDVIESMTKHSLKNILKTITADEKYSRLADFLSDRHDQIWPAYNKITKVKSDGGFNVVNHGDLWVNNMLFKYNNSGEVADVKFIDYQLSRLGSPVNDLIIFIWTSTDEEVRGSRQKELFSIYLTTLNKTLADLGCEERLSEQELRSDVIRSVDLVVGLISFNFALMIAGPEDVPDLANMTEDDFDSDKFNKLFKGKNYNKLLPNYFKHITEFFLDGKGVPGQNS